MRLSSRIVSLEESTPSDRLRPGAYTCPELGRTCHRPGAYDAAELPSLFGAQLRYPDGRIAHRAANGAATPNPPPRKG